MSDLAMHFIARGPVCKDCAEQAVYEKEMTTAPAAGDYDTAVFFASEQHDQTIMNHGDVFCVDCNQYLYSMSLTWVFDELTTKSTLKDLVKERD